MNEHLTAGARIAAGARDERLVITVAGVPARGGSIGHLR
jgi:hypothetical protein